jgi:Xaa-Pro aminopeptidase
MMLALPDRAALAAALELAGADGWLLYDFQGVNPVLGQVLGITGMGSRRLFVYLPRTGEPVAVAHRIELQSVAGFPGRVLPYARWEELHDALRSVVAGKRVAMEVAPDDAVPYLDRVPSGVVQLLARLGATVVPSAALVTRFASTWSADDLADHLAAAVVLARVAQEALQRAVVAGGSGLSESALQQEVIDAIHVGGLVFDHPPIVGFGPSAANPHYEPRAGADRTLARDEVVLLDLWGGRRMGAVYADQTWMGFSGSRPPAEVQRVWEAVRSARDAAIEFVQSGWSADRPMHGYEVDRAARAIITEAGYGADFVHRTGHSIDHRLHGSGPHLDDYETHDDRQLLTGTGFSVEPGVYLTGRFGVRSEVNMYLVPGEAFVTPAGPQRELITGA